MHTQRTIGLIVAAIFVVVIGVWVGAMSMTSWVVGTVVVGCFGSALVAAWSLLRPWHRRWGASSTEATASMPGDDLLPDAVQTTRVISIDGPRRDVWPWLVQIGWGRAGWYSYDWIDNDRRPSACAIEPAWQHLETGHVIAMTPTLGFTVRTIEPARCIVSQAPNGTTWCLQLMDGPDSTCRLISRFRVPRHPGSIAASLWTLLADPGSFIMERRMLLGIRHRVTQTPRVATRADL